MREREREKKKYVDLFAVNLFSEWASFSGLNVRFGVNVFTDLIHIFFFLSLMLHFNIAVIVFKMMHAFTWSHKLWTITKIQQHSQCCRDHIQTVHPFSSRLDIFVSFSIGQVDDWVLICIFMIGIKWHNIFQFLFFITRFQLSIIWPVALRMITRQIKKTFTYINFRLIWLTACKSHLLFIDFYDRMTQIQGKILIFFSLSLPHKAFVATIQFYYLFSFFFFSLMQTQSLKAKQCIQPRKINIFKLRLRTDLPQTVLAALVICFIVWFRWLQS